MAKNAATLAAVPPSVEWTTTCRIADALRGPESCFAHRRLQGTAQSEIGGVGTERRVRNLRGVVDGLYDVHRGPLDTLSNEAAA